MTEKTLADLSESFALFDNWEDKYRYLIDLGDRLEPMDEALKTEENMVRGCTSRVWMAAGVKDGLFHFLADSDARIVKGLIYLLVIAYQDKSPSDILRIDINKTFEDLGLHQHISPNRRNGFFSMVERIRTLAAGAA